MTDLSVETSERATVGPVAQWLVAGVTLVAFFAVRLPVLRFSPQWGTMEHHEFGLFAMHLAVGFIGPLPDYLPESHQGCTFLFGALAAPFLAIGGPTVESLRVASLVLHGAIAAIFAALGTRVGGVRTGLVAAALLVVAPPMMVHFAHKGSTNHDDADLFVGLVLLLLVVPRRAPGRFPWRAGLLGFVVGVAGVYLLDGALRALAAIGASLLVTGRPGRKEVRAFCLCLLMVCAVGWWSGIRMGPTTSVGHAILDTPLVPGLDRQGDLKPGMAGRVADLFRVAIPQGFRGGYPLLFEWGTMPEWVRGWAYPLGLLLLILLGGLPAGWAARGPPGDPQLRLRVLLERICWAVVLVQVLAVLASSLDVAPDYIVPVWPYLVLLAALAVTPRPGEGWGRSAARLVSALLVLALPLSVSAGAVWPDLRGFYTPPVGEKDGDAAKPGEQAAFAQSLFAGRLGMHLRGYRLVGERDDERLLKLAAERPLEVVSFARMRGYAAAHHLIQEACGDATSSGFEALEPGMESGSTGVFWEGVGEALARWPEPCQPLALRQMSDLESGSERMGGGNEPILAGTTPLGATVAELYRGSTPQAASFLFGLAQGLLDERDAAFDGLERVFPEGPEREAFCVAAGRWAYNWLRPVELSEWLSVSQACSPEQLAVGWGVGLARDRPPDSALGIRPNYRWWRTDPGERELAAFDCAWERGREEVQAMFAGQETPELGWRQCLPENPPLEGEPGPGDGATVP